MSLFTRLRELDAYSKPMEDFRVKTLSGGMVSLVASVAITVLAVQETYHFFSGDVVEQLYVDSTSSDVRVNVRFDVTFHYLPCPFISVDVMDVSSENQDNIQDDVFKLRLDANGRNVSEAVQKIEINQNRSDVELKTTTVGCGSCYGALPLGAAATRAKR